LNQVLGRSKAFRFGELDFLLVRMEFGAPIASGKASNCRWHGRLKCTGFLPIINIAQFGREEAELDFHLLRRGATMSIVGILSSNLFSAGAAQSTQSSSNNPSRFQQIRTEFQQLGQDLQSGNLTQAQSDFAALSQNLSGAGPSAAANTNTAAATSNSPLLQAFTQLGQDLQSGNLQGAQQDFTNLQQGVQQISSQQVGGHHRHHHHAESSESSSASTQQSNPIVQAFSTLAQDLQAGNLSGAQSAFATLQNDLQQIGGLLTAGSNGASSTAVPSSAGSLNVTA
jgi:outer membrane protein assembly factor BamD (BamD/ComL family)